MNIEYMNHEINIPRGKATIFVIWAQPDKRPTAGHKACLIAHSGRAATLMIRIRTCHMSACFVGLNSSGCICSYQLPSCCIFVKPIMDNSLVMSLCVADRPGLAWIH